MTKKLHIVLFEKFLFRSYRNFHDAIKSGEMSPSLHLRSLCWSICPSKSTVPCCSQFSNSIAEGKLFNSWNIHPSIFSIEIETMVYLRIASLDRSIISCFTLQLCFPSLPAPRAAIFDSVWAKSSPRLTLDASISASALDNFSVSYTKYRR